MTPAPLQVGQAPSELALNSAGLTPLALANALRIGSSSPVYVAGLLRREPRIGLWSTETTPDSAGTDPCMRELLPEPAQQAVHPLDVVRVQAGGRLVEDVGDVGERGAEVADHLDALRLTAGEGARGPVEREIAQADLHERVEGVLQRAEQRRHRRL